MKSQAVNAERAKAQSARQSRAPKKRQQKKPPKKQNKSKLVYEPFEWRGISSSHIIGLDEAGRGCLAGPVVAAAVILQSEFDLDLLTDSKLLSEPRREIIYEKIMSLHLVGVGFATAAEVDDINILQASFLAMRRALTALGKRRGHLLVDGHLKIPGVKGYEQTALVKGDLRCQPISAASIIAKVTRDRLMRELAKEFPDYGFEIHKGYGTAFHREMLFEKGPCKEHRLTFAGVISENEIGGGVFIGDESSDLALQDGLVG
jgi:ribonuclease HII